MTTPVLCHLKVPVYPGRAIDDLPPAEQVAWLEAHGTLPSRNLPDYVRCSAPPAVWVMYGSKVDPDGTVHPRAPEGLGGLERPGVADVLVALALIHVRSTGRCPAELGLTEIAAALEAEEVAWATTLTAARAEVEAWAAALPAEALVWRGHPWETPCALTHARRESGGEWSLQHKGSARIDLGPTHAARAEAALAAHEERVAKEKAETERIAKEKAETERIAKEKAEAEYQAGVAEVLAAATTPDHVRERHAAGVLPGEELAGLLRAKVFGPLADQPRYQRILVDDLDHDGCEEPHLCVATETLEALSADHWARAQTLRALLPGAAVTLERRTGRCDEDACGATLTRHTLRVAVARYGHMWVLHLACPGGES